MFAGLHRLIGGISHTLADHEERIKELGGSRQRKRFATAKTGYPWRIVRLCRVLRWKRICGISGVQLNFQ